MSKQMPRDTSCNVIDGGPVWPYVLIFVAFWVGMVVIWAVQ